MTRILEFVLVGGLILSAAAFGGTDPAYFSIVQFVFLGTGGLLMVNVILRPSRKSALPAAIPLLLFAITFTHVMPLPVFANSTLGWITAAPFETLPQLTVWATYLSAFYMAIAIYRSTNGGGRVIFAMLSLGAVEACYGLVQYLTGYPLIFGYTKTINLEMATGTYINYDHFAGLMEMLVPIALAGAFFQLASIQGNNRNKFEQPGTFPSREDFPKLVLWLLLASLFLVALVFSESRTGLAAAILSTLLMIVLVMTSPRQKASAFLLSLAFCGPMLAMVIWIGPGPVIARFERLIQRSTSARESRVAIWKDTLHLIGEHPWAGTGLGTFANVYPAVQTAFPGQTVGHAHNDYLEFASECGIPAALILFGSVFYIVAQSVWAFWKNKRNFQRAVALGCFGSMVAILLHSLTDFNLHIPANALVFAVILGISYANSSVTRETHQIEVRRTANS